VELIIIRIVLIGRVVKLEPWSLAQCVPCMCSVCLKTEKENIIFSMRLVYDMRAFWRYIECRT